MTILDSGLTTEERVRVGVVGELRFDRSNASLRVHDGGTAGGYELLSRPSLDALYAAQTPDLAALANPGPNDLGLMIRNGKGSYRFRALTVNTAGLAITNGSGESGNPLIALAGTITSAHTFSAPLTAAGGVVGNVTGDLTGDSAGTHTGPVVGDVAGNLTGGVTGSVDARGGSLLVDADAIPMTAINGLAAALNALVFSLPVGLVMLWSGSAASIPAGFALCDGANGTPDLTSRFVMGAGGALNPGDTGGASTHTHTATAADGGAHQHSVTVEGTALDATQMPAHSHSNGVTDAETNTVFNRGSVAANPTTSDSIDNNNSNGIYEGLTSSAGGGQPHTHTASSADSGTHTHGITVDAQNNLPPYYALCYIMVTG